MSSRSLKRREQIKAQLLVKAQDPLAPRRPTMQSSPSNANPEGGLYYISIYGSIPLAQPSDGDRLSFRIVFNKIPFVPYNETMNLTMGQVTVQLAAC
jgi:hypothetical protein